MNQKIILIGAGLVGSLKAIYLARRGYRVSVYEKLPDIRKHPIPAGRSINLALANRGIAALQRVGLMNDVNKLLIPMRGRMIHSEDGAQSLQPYGQKPEEVIYSVSRAGLVSLLRNHAEATGRVRFHFHCQLEEIDFDLNQCRLFNSETQETVHDSYDVLIGCDGGGSKVRSAMQAVGALQERSELLDHAYKELNIPPADHGAHRIEANALHIWPRENHMLIALPNTDGSFTVTLFLPNEGPVSFASIEDGDALKSLFNSQFADAAELINDLEHSFFSNPTGHLGTVRCDRWQHRNVLLSGDAAHAIVPFHGQGMNAGFEDCLALNESLDAHQDNWRKAMPDFVHKRKPNANAIADMALENYVEMRSSVRDARFRLKKQIAFRLEQMMPEYFIPRYSMVMFHLLPYSEAQHRGRIQAHILSQLSEGIDALEQLDEQRAERLVKQQLPRLHKTA